MASFPNIPGLAQQQNGNLGAINGAHQQISSKLGAINTLKAQKKASTNTDEQNALQTLINLRVAEIAPLLTTYTNGVNAATSS